MVGPWSVAAAVLSAVAFALASGRGAKLLRVSDAARSGVIVRLPWLFLPVAVFGYLFGSALGHAGSGSAGAMLRREFVGLDMMLASSILFLTGFVLCLKALRQPGSVYRALSVVIFLLYLVIAMMTANQLKS